MMWRILCALILFVLAFAALAREGGYPLHEAARHGDTAAVAALLADGRDVDARDRGRWTPLVWAAAYLHDDTLRILIAAGADLEAIGRAGKNSGTALMWAAKKPLSRSTVALLLAAGADPDGTDQYGRTALMMAAQTGRVENMRLLIAHGADVNRVNDLPPRHGRTALEIARKWGETEAADLLKQSGAMEWAELVAAGAAPATQSTRPQPRRPVRSRRARYRSASSGSRPRRLIG